MVITKGHTEVEPLPAQAYLQEKLELVALAFGRYPDLQFIHGRDFGKSFTLDRGILIFWFNDPETHSTHVAYKRVEEVEL